MQLILIRGLPGSGKSTIAALLAKAGFTWLEADHYFLNEKGIYCFKKEDIGIAHAECQIRAYNALKEGKDVVVSNTFTRLWEMNPYFDMAKKFNISPNVIEARGRWPNVHGVPAEVIAKMQERWEPL